MQPWYRRIDTLHNKLSDLVGGESRYKHLDSKSLKVLRNIERPRTEDSLRDFFTATKDNDLKKDTGLESDKKRRRDLFTKMTTEEYYESLNALIKLDQNYVFPSLTDLTRESKNGVMAIANQLGMHVCRWLEPISMLEAKNSLNNSRSSIREVLSAFPIILDNPTGMAPAPPSATNKSDSDASAGAPAMIPRATLTHFEDALCEVAAKYCVDFTAQTLGKRSVLSIESLAKETIPEYRTRFVDNAGWRALMELVVVYFGADRLQHKTVKGFMLAQIVSTLL